MKKNSYPYVMIHGFGGYGAQDKQDIHAHYWGIGPLYLKDHFAEKGVEFYNPSLGPFNSTWDRACILWAYLFGGTVDFGKVHAKKYHHARYGYTFEHGALEDLGQPGPHRKMNLMGHSFGGPTVIEVCQLFSFGDEDERRGTDPEDLSPLFAGGYGDLIHTATTMSGVNNGTLMASALGVKGMTAATYFVLMIASMVGETRWTKFWDFKLQHFGIGKFCSHFSRLDHVYDYACNMDRDNYGREMQVEVIQLLNQALKMDPHILLFCPARRFLRPGQKRRRQLPPQIPDGSALLLQRLPDRPIHLAGTRQIRRRLRSPLAIQ